MRVSYNWLKEYVDLSTTTPEDLATRMTLSGVAVEHVIHLDKGITKVITGRIEGLEKHPDANKLQICRINTGSGELLQIVTGAANVAVGQVVPVSIIGAKLPSGLAIKKSKLRGVESFGMLCSGEELGIEKKLLPENQQEGILILPPDTPLGLDIKEVLGLDDVVLELELTPNRADCLSMVGVAREVAAVLGTEFKPPVISVEEEKETLEGKFQVEIENQELCPRYVAKAIRDVKIGASPAWLQRRLQAAGVRPISNVVDVTNYVMLELGQPLHAFDMDTLKGQKIIVRNAREGEELVSLDGQTRKLDESMLVIADAEGPVAIAGVMGGLDTEVTADTKAILLESAYFNGTSIRLTSRKLGLRSEASHRFEKGIDLGGCPRAADRAAQLFAQLAGGKIVRGAIDNKVREPQEAVVTLSFDRLNQYTGLEIPPETVKQILTGLQFKVQTVKGGVKVTVPTSRPDITIDVDLIEEVIRLYGYDKVPTTLPVEATTQGSKTFTQKLEDLTRDTMESCGLSEVVNLSFANPRVLEGLGLPDDSPLRKVVTIQNPLSEEQRVLRTSLLPGIFQVLNTNSSRRNKDGAIYEMSRVFWPAEGSMLPQEPLMLAGAGMGSTEIYWDQPRVAYDYYFLKGVLETLLTRLGVQEYSFLREESNPTFHPGRTAKILVGDQEAGVVGQVHPDVAEYFEIPAETCAFQLNLNIIMQAASLTIAYTQLPKFPGVDRDLAVVVKEAVSVEELQKVIVKAGGKLLRQVKLFDVFRGKQIEEGYKSLALSLQYQAQDRTLTDEEVNACQEKVAQALAKETGAVLR